MIAHYREYDNTIQTVDDHLNNTSKLCKIYASKFGMENIGLIIGLIHDFGKYSSHFQNYIKSQCNLIKKGDANFIDIKTDHSTAGGQLIWKEVTNSNIAQVLSVCVMSHHSGLIDCLSIENSSPIDSFRKRVDKEDSKTHYEECKSSANASLILNKFLSEIKSLKFPKLNLSDKKNNLIYNFEIGFLTKLLFSCLIDADRTDTIIFQNNKNIPIKYTNWDVLIEKLEKHMCKFKTDYEIDKIRNNISNECKLASERDKGIYTLSVPTGGGKTLSSLRFALYHAKKHNIDRIFYIIPFTSIIEQNAKVAKDILGREVVLEHHSNIESQSWDEKILTDNWDAQIIYTTNVRLLETMFGKGTSNARRLHQLTNSIIIFDEIQTLPIKCVHIFNNAINFLVNNCGTSVVLCTATQPLLNKVCDIKGAIQLKGNHEIIKDVNKLFSTLHRVDLIDKTKQEGWSDSEIKKLIIENVDKSNSCLIICNTKKTAKNIFNNLKGISDIETYHLSTSMCPQHRKDILDKIKSALETNKRIVCVSTQLIEAGVDIDFGSVIRFIAGLDSIAQAAGRCNRNGKRKIGEVSIINYNNENLYYLKDIQKGIEVTQRILRERLINHDDTDLLSPDNMEKYYQYYFYDRQADMNYPITIDNNVKTSILSLLSNNNIMNINSGLVLKQSFKLAANEFKAIDSNTFSILVPYKKGSDLINKIKTCKDIKKISKLLKMAQHYVVNVFQNKFDNLIKENKLCKLDDLDIYYLLDNNYDMEYGIND